MPRVLLACALAASTSSSATAGNGQTILDGNIDVRINAAGYPPPPLPDHALASAAAFAAPGGGGAVIHAAIENLLRHTPGLRIRRSSATGAIAAMYSESGALSDAAPGQSDLQIARAFLSAHRDGYGLSSADIDDLTVLGDSPGGASGLRMLRVEQRIDGVPIFESETRLLIDPDGRVWRVLGALVPTALTPAPRFDRSQLISPETALYELVGRGGFELDRQSISASAVNDGWFALHAAKPVAGPAAARLVLFPLSPGVLVPAWSLTVFTSGDEDWYALIDASSGDLLWRTNTREFASTQQARFSVYLQQDGKTPADSPAPQSPNAAIPGAGTQYPAIARSIANMLSVQSPLASPNGWIDDCPGSGSGCDSTRGNNVEACLDRDATDDVCDTGALDADGRAIGNPDASARNRDFLGATPRDFDYTPAPLGANPDAGDNPTNPDSQRGALVQAFYVVNWYHDRLLALGFDEGAGNFQQLNLQGQGGMGGDRIAVDVQNAGANNASFSTPADGAGPGRLQASIFPGRHQIATVRWMPASWCTSSATACHID